MDDKAPSQMPDEIWIANVSTQELILEIADKENLLAVKYTRATSVPSDKERVIYIKITEDLGDCKLCEMYEFDPHEDGFERLVITHRDGECHE